MHKPNFPVTSKEDNKQYWISRSVAVVGVPMFIYQGKKYVPLAKRSESMNLEAGKWGLPCGFLDWGESAQEAIVREISEELGFDIPLEDIPNQPNLVVTEPNSKENDTVSLRYYIYKSVDELPLLEGSDESHNAHWVALQDLNRYELAFNNLDIIKQALYDYETKYLISNGILD